MSRFEVAFCVLVLCGASAQVQAQTAPASKVANPIENDGTVKVPPFRLPPSVYASPAANAALPRSPEDFGPMLERLVKSGSIAQIRASMRTRAETEVSGLASAYRVHVEAGEVGGVHGYWARPDQPAKGKAARILINLPGGAFIMGDAASTGMKESIPVAGLTGIPVFSVDYRQAPEAKFPAASEDVAAIYRAVLAEYKAPSIGIFGCSAGGLLTAQALAWFQKEKLPTPGAAGIFCASADARWGGDSWSWQMPIQGIDREPSLDERFYYGGHDLSDPLMSPIMSDEVLSHFPPTLIITATRAGELSSAVNTHRVLIRNGVAASLHAWDGLGHAFFLNPELPESKEAFRVMADFFTAHLKGR
ncbi:alpha/beta hydrolase fold domain-containing protein (plasmid) [Novosphingobium sp. BL-8A]|uniref:alpha/beta hydrolase n=1 Tax=Novosphingobium sp. BL-8A TaxID=3127639 RepID=UPI0037566EFB